MKTLFLSAYTAPSGGGTFLPSDRSDLVNWYRKGIGQTNVSGLTSWSDQKGTDNLDHISGAKGAINGDGTVTWAGNGSIWKDTQTGYKGLNADETAYTSPWAIYARLRVDAFDANDQHVLFKETFWGVEYRVSAINDILIIGLSTAAYGPGGSGVSIEDTWISVAHLSTSVNERVLISNAGTPPWDPWALGGNVMKGHSLAGTGEGTHYANCTIAEFIFCQGTSHDDTDVAQMFGYLDGLT